MRESADLNKNWSALSEFALRVHPRVTIVSVRASRAACLHGRVLYECVNEEQADKRLRVCVFYGQTSASASAYFRAHRDASKAKCNAHKARTAGQKAQEIIVDDASM